MAFPTPCVQRRGEHCCGLAGAQPRSACGFLMGRAPAARTALKRSTHTSRDGRARRSDPLASMGHKDAFELNPHSPRGGASAYGDVDCMPGAVISIELGDELNGRLRISSMIQWPEFGTMPTVTLPRQNASSSPAPCEGFLGRRRRARHRILRPWRAAPCFRPHPG